MSKKADRLNRIMQILKMRNGASIRELSSELEVSEMTVRRDLEVLSASRLVTLIQGVAIYHPANETEGEAILNKEYNLSAEHLSHRSEKERIGAKAASLLEPNDVIVIDTGTTTEQLARFIPEAAALTALCYNMNILIELNLKKNTKIICGGGYYHSNTQMFQSPEGISLISRTCANKAFISAAGISSKMAVTCIDQYEIETKKAAIASSLTKILLADSSKFDKVCPAMFANLTEFDMIITDKGLSEEWLDYIGQMEIELLLV